MENLLAGSSNEKEEGRIIAHITGCAEAAIKYGLFFEWLESFVGAWNETKNPYVAANAGRTEWDF
jgi:hypothetical protein